MLGKFFILGFVILNLGFKDSVAEEPTSPRNPKQIELRNLLTLSTSDEGASQSNGVFDRGVVMKDGAKYRKFESRFGSIIVLDTAKLSPHDIERALCVPGMAPGISETSDSTLVQAEVKAGSGSDWKGYVALIQQTIKSKCDGSVPMTTGVNPHLDLGVSRSIKDKNGDDTEIRVFNRDLGPNLNFGAHF